MAVSGSVTKQALDKIQDQLTCAVCLDTYAQPLLLNCSHVFCKSCLELIIVQSTIGPTIHCPKCRKVTVLPEGAVSNLQNAFYINELFDVRDTLQRTQGRDSNEKKQCEKCEDDGVVSFSRECQSFFCVRCVEAHRLCDEYTSHDIISIEEFEEEVQQMMSLKQTKTQCPQHLGEKLEFFCESCDALICKECTLSLHRTHKHALISQVFDKLKSELSPSLELVEKHASALNSHEEQIQVQRADLQGDIEIEVDKLQRAMEERKTELIAQVDEMTQQKLKVLSNQRGDLELVQTELNSCVKFMSESVMTGGNGEALLSGSKLRQQIKELTQALDPATMYPLEGADMRFICNSGTAVLQACQSFGQVYSQPACPKKCRVKGKGCRFALVGQENAITLHTFDSEGRECTQEIPAACISCTLIANGAETDPFPVDYIEGNQYEIFYNPSVRGRQQLKVQIEGQHIRGSPFSILAKPPLSQIGSCIHTLSGVHEPWGVALTASGMTVVAEFRGNRISLINKGGEIVKRIGEKGDSPGNLSGPRGIAIDKDGNILVADSFNHRIQKFTPGGTFLQAVGRKGQQKLEFLFLDGLAIGPNEKVYVCADRNHCVEVLNADLTHHSRFGDCGTQNGQMYYPYDIAFDSGGNLYLVDNQNHRVQVFTQDGEFLRKFGKQGKGDGELSSPTSICIDAEDMVYITEKDNHRVSIFSTGGEFLGSFGSYGKLPGQFHSPHGIAINDDGFVYVTDRDNNRVQIF